MNRFGLYRVFLCLLALIALTASNVNASPEEKKPFVVVVYADWCPYCQNLKPILALINSKYNGKIHFVRLDVTSPTTMSASEEQARQNGLGSFFQKYKDLTSLVVIQDASRHEVFRAVHDYDFQHYADVLDKQLRVQR